MDEERCFIQVTNLTSSFVSENKRANEVFKMTLDTESLYRILYKHMGPQGWWPADSKIEIILGAILVQNTNWRNAAYAIDSLKQATLLDPHHILNLELEDLQTLIKSSGFYKNKAKTILALLSWLHQYDFDYKAIAHKYHTNLRDQLLHIKGVEVKQPMYSSFMYLKVSNTYLTVTQEEFIVYSDMNIQNNMTN